MSAAALTAVPLEGRDERPGLGRLTLVELRKMTDTRAGFWLQLAIAALTVFVAVAVAIWGVGPDQQFGSLLGATIQPASILGPVVGVLLVSSEWSQRTAQITFGLVPRRGRVVVAKLLAGLAWSALAFALAVGAAAVAAAVANVDGAWDVPTALVFQDALYVVISVLGGIALARRCSPRRPRSSSTSCCRSAGRSWARCRSWRASRAGWTAPARRTR